MLFRSSVENIAREIFLALEVLFEPYKPTLVPQTLVLYETPNCYTECRTVPSEEREAFLAVRGEHLKEYAAQKGVVEYDDRLVGTTNPPEGNRPRHVVPLDPIVKHSGNSSLTTNYGSPPKHADTMRPGQDAPVEPEKPKSTWDFGTKWI